MKFILVLLFTAKPLLMTSIQPLASITKELVGEKYRVESLLNGQQNPHTYEPSPGDIGKVERAALYFEVGLNLESWGDRMCKAARKCIKVGEILKERGVPIKNPHIWLDPVKAKKIAGVIVEELVSVFPQDSTDFYSNLSKFEARVDSLISWTRSKTEILTDKKFISYHPAWEDFAHTLGFDLVDVVVEHGSKEVSTKRLAEVIKEAKNKGVRVIVVEKGFPSRVPHIIASEINGRTVELDPLFSGYYVDEMKKNIENLIKGLRWQK